MDASAELTLLNDWTIAKLREVLRENNQIISGSKRNLSKEHAVLLFQMETIYPISALCQTGPHILLKFPIFQRKIFLIIFSQNEH